MNKPLVYIASPLKYRELNTQISEVLEDNKIAHFLPHTINLPDAQDKLKIIGDKCFYEIEKANIVLVVSPFGLSTAAEIGYAINRKIKNENIKIILIDQDPSLNKRIDATISPYFDVTIHELKHLAKEIINLQKKS